VSRKALDLALGKRSLAERLLEILGVAVILLILAAIVGYEGGRAIMQVIAPVAPLPLAARQAPACALTSVDALEEINLGPTRTFEFDGATYGLHRGEAECTIRGARDPFSKAKVKDRLAFCEFSNPGGLTVETPGAAFAFAPGATRPATVWFDGGKPQCATDSSLNITERLRHLREHR
jgi:hypothetical protein